jgi:hypothetical protein
MPTAATTEESARAREWIARLETDPIWTERLRAELAPGDVAPGDLVLVLAPAAHYPKAAQRAGDAEHALRVGEWLAIATSVDEVIDVMMPVNDRDALQAREPRDQAHGLVLAGPRAVAFRFSVPRR